ncbi:MAG TPA: hypothetical protein ENN66_05295 [Proteobacteria bacterium]|nr:hypothetical protein [Pseudomonadota bacterium]
METLANNPKISLLSRMNAFYGIPNMSIETSMAIDQGMQAPEVYFSKARAEQATLQRGPENDNSRLSDLDSQITEIIEISRQAASLQQQNSTLNQTLPTAPQDHKSPQPTTAYQAEANQTSSSVYSLKQLTDTGSARNSLQLNTEDKQPTAASSLNGETQTAASDRKNLLQSSLRSASPYPGIMAGLGGGSATSNSSQPGAIFSALG